MLLGDGALGDVPRILKEETARAMLSDQLDGKPAPMLALSGGAFGYGLAVHDVTRRRGPKKGTVWWGGIAGTGFWVDRESRAVGVFMIQTMNEIQHADAFPERRLPLDRLLSRSESAHPPRPRRMRGRCLRKGGHASLEPKGSSRRRSA